MDSRGAPACDRFMLWVDGVGAYLLATGDDVFLGQASGQGGADIPILADISGRHACIRRDEGDYLMEATGNVQLDGRVVRRFAALRDGSRVELRQTDVAHGVRLLFRQPHRLSATARLDFLSRHRTQPPADSVLLWADSCVLGPKPESHVVCRDWPQEVILYRHGSGFYCSTRGSFLVDGKACHDRGRLTPRSRVSGEGFSFCLEALDE
ncbi:MAG: FHA domain-containing protein [Thermoguttaceae bacterium]|jgi:hypothetical protein